jgi:hypothetical protein
MFSVTHTLPTFRLMISLEAIKESAKQIQPNILVNYLSNIQLCYPAKVNMKDKSCKKPLLLLNILAECIYEFRVMLKTKII